MTADGARPFPLLSRPLPLLSRPSSSVPQVEDFRDSNVNLGINQYAAFEPPLAPKRKYRDVEFTMWDTLDIDASTVQDVLDYFDKMDMEVRGGTPNALAAVVA